MVATPADVRGVGILLWPYCPMNEPLSANSPIFFCEEQSNRFSKFKFKKRGMQTKVSPETNKRAGTEKKNNTANVASTEGSRERKETTGKRGKGRCDCSVCHCQFSLGASVVSVSRLVDSFPVRILFFITRGWRTPRTRRPASCRTAR